MTRFTKTSIVVVGSLSALALAGCSAAAPTPSGSVDGNYSDTITVAATSSIPSLDVHTSTSGVAVQIAANIYESLFALDTEFIPQPMLVSDYEVSEDGLTYTFQLREGVVFHDGSALDSADVVASLNRWKQLAGRATAMLGESEFVAADESTVTITLASPRSDLTAQLANPLQPAVIMPSEIVEGAGVEPVTEFIGTGPYELAEYAADQRVSLTRFDEYQSVDSAPSGYAGSKSAPTKDLVYEFVTDGATRLAMYSSGQLPVVDFGVDNLAQVEAVPGTEIRTVLDGDQAIVFNKRSPIFSDLRMREALNLAIDSAAYLQGVTNDESLFRLNPSIMFEENVTWFSTEGEQAYNARDLDAARALLEEAGYDGTPVRLLTSRDFGNRFYPAAVMLQSQAAEIGLNVELVESDYATLIARRNDETAWDLYAGAFLVPSTPSQVIWLGANYGWPDDPRLAELVAASASAMGDEQIRTAADDLQGYIWESLPGIKVGDVYAYYATRDTLEDVQFAVGGPVLWNARLRE